MEAPIARWRFCGLVVRAEPFDAIELSLESWWEGIDTDTGLE